MNERLYLPLFALLAAPAVAADEVKRTLEAHPRGTVTISNTAGSVEVSGWSRSEVDVEADLGSGVEELIVRRDGNEVRIEVPDARRNDRSVSSDLVVRIPEASSLSIGVVSADIDVRDVYGRQRLHAVSGDIATEAYEADLQAETVSGDIEIGADGGSIFTQLTSVSGDIDATNLRGDIELSSVSGDVTLDGGQFDRLQANTVNGELDLHVEITAGGRADMETINGAIELRLIGDFDARYDIETFNGDIRTCFGPEASRTSRYTPGQELKFTEGDGDTQITIRALNGDVDVCHD